MKNSFLIPAYPLKKGELGSKGFMFMHEVPEMRECIHFLRRVNCFIGANNSGKSRLIRAMLGGIEPVNKKESAIGIIDLNSQYNLLWQIVKKKKDGSLDNPKADCLVDLFDRGFYVFENFPKIYEHWDKLRGVNEEELMGFFRLFEGNYFYQELNRIRERITQCNRNIDNYNGRIKQLNQGIEELNVDNGHIKRISNQIDNHKLLEKKNKELENIQNIVALKTSLVVLKENKKKASGNQLIHIEEAINRFTEDITTAEEQDYDVLVTEIEELKALGLPNRQSLERDLQNFQNRKIDNQIEKNKIQIEKTQKDKKTAEASIKIEQTELESQFRDILRGEIQMLIGKGVELLNNVRTKIPKLYIPILRGTRPLDDSKTDYYAERTKKDYQINETFTGLSIFKELQEHLLGRFEQRRLIREFEEFLSKSFFDGKEVSLIPYIKGDVVHIRIGEEERPIYELGDGIQSLIVLTFPLFLRKDEEWAIFIEEPEAHLHPTWQRFFLKTIDTYFSKHQFFFSTHSNVFINHGEVSSYHVFQDETDGLTAIRYIDKDSSGVLETLGYKASDLLYANYIVWVEGPSDKVYVKAFIEAFDKTLIEGEHYSIMFYGGCTQLLGHISIDNEALDEGVRILFINPKCGFILDSDLKAAGHTLSRERVLFQNDCEAKGLYCWITGGREMENLIPGEVWEAAAIRYAKGLRNNGNLSVSGVVFPGKPEDDYRFLDLCPNNGSGTKVSLVGKVNPINININDKILMAKAIVKDYPKSVEDLRMNGELFTKVEELVGFIRRANQLEQVGGEV